jgi:hypothetical protein
LATLALGGIAGPLSRMTRSEYATAVWQRRSEITGVVCTAVTVSPGKTHTVEVRMYITLGSNAARMKRHRKG